MNQSTMRAFRGEPQPNDILMTAYFIIVSRIFVVHGLL